jgi:hypothetical protein
MFSQTSSIAILSTYFTKHGSHNFMTFMWFPYYASMNLLRLVLLSYHSWLSCHGLKHFTHLSPWASSSSVGIAGFVVRFYSIMYRFSGEFNMIKVFILSVHLTHIWHSWVSIYLTYPGVLLPHKASLHLLTPSYYSFRWLKFNTTTLVYFFQ